MVYFLDFGVKIPLANSFLILTLSQLYSLIQDDFVAFKTASANVLKKLGFVNLGETMRFCKSHNQEMKEHLVYLELERFQNLS